MRFTNKSLSVHFNNVFYLPKEDSANSICRVYSGMIDRTKISGSKFYRKQLVTITNLENDRKIVRQVVGPFRVAKALPGEPPKKGLSMHDIGLDYDARDELGIDSKDVKTIVKVAGRLDQFLYFWNHQDRAIRFSTKGRVESFLLGLVGVGLGVLSVVLSVTL